MKSFIFSNPIYLEAQEKKTTATKMKTQHLAINLMCVFKLVYNKFKEWII